MFSRNWVINFIVSSHISPSKNESIRSSLQFTTSSCLFCVRTMLELSPCFLMIKRTQESPLWCLEIFRLTLKTSVQFLSAVVFVVRIIPIINFPQIPLLNHITSKRLMVFLHCCFLVCFSLAIILFLEPLNLCNLIQALSLVKCVILSTTWDNYPFSIS